MCIGSLSGTVHFVETAPDGPPPPSHGRTGGSPNKSRRNYRVTQRELARRLARAHSYVSRIEKGDRRIDVPEMIQWCAVLGTDPVKVMERIMHRRTEGAS
jgi:hypothetical protein